MEAEDDFDVEANDEEILEDDVSDIEIAGKDFKPPVYVLDGDRLLGEEFLNKNFLASQEDAAKIVEYINSQMVLMK